MLMVLRQPSWIGLTAIVVVLCVAFTVLGLWQLRRHDERAAANLVLAANLGAPAVAAGDLLPTRDQLPTVDEWRLVTATGRYDPAQELLLRNRSYEGQLGYEVITPLVPSDGPAVLVVRGWVPAGPDAGTPPDVPAPPGGDVTVSARARPSLTGSTDAAGLPANQVRRLVVPAIAAALPYEVREGGYAQLVVGAPGSTEDGAGPRALEVPEPALGPHRPYAVQWFLFGVIAIVGWAVLLRAAADEPTSAGTASKRERSAAPIGQQ